MTKQVTFPLYLMRMEAISAKMVTMAVVVLAVAATIEHPKLWFKPMLIVTAIRVVG